MSTNPITRLQLTQYSLLAIPIAFAGFPLYILAPDFYATHYGVSLSTLGFVLLGLRLFDAIQDPFIGMMSDRFSHKILPTILTSCLLLVAGIYALFNAMPTNPLLWFAVCMAVSVTAYSIIGINLNTLGALWTSDKTAQTRITSTREALGLVGLLIAVILPSVLGKFIAKENLYIWFSTTLCVLMLVAASAFARWFSGQKIKLSRTHQPSQRIRDLLFTLAPETRRLFLVYGLSVLASSIPAVLVIFFTRDLLQSEAHTGLFLLLYFLSGALAMPLWKRLSNRYTKPRAWLFSMLLAVASFIWAFFLGVGDIWQYGMICIASGIALGGDLALPPSILADHIHKHRTESSAATQFSALTLLTKLGLALASAITFPLLDWAGFIPASTNAGSALFALSAAYALIPCLIKLTACYFLYRLLLHTKEKEIYETSVKNRVIGSDHHA